jgi:hypothetical protein
MICLSQTHIDGGITTLTSVPRVHWGDVCKAKIQIGADTVISFLLVGLSDIPGVLTDEFRTLVRWSVAGVKGKNFRNNLNLSDTLSTTNPKWTTLNWIWTSDLWSWQLTACDFLRNLFIRFFQLPIILFLTEQVTSMHVPASKSFLQCLLDLPFTVGLVALAVSFHDTRTYGQLHSSHDFASHSSSSALHGFDLSLSWLHSHVSNGFPMSVGL